MTKIRSLPRLPATLALTALLLTACSVGPDYKRPDVAAPAGYKEAGGWQPAQPNDQAPRGQWWSVFGDADLDALIAQVQVSNQNLKAAEARYRQATALVQAARAGFFPTVTANASTTRSRAGSRGGIDNGTGISAVSATSQSYNLSLGASWEIDLWGRVRRQVEASRASADASAADLEGVRLSLQSELATDYFQLRVVDVQKDLLDDTVAAFEKSLGLTRNRYAAGVAARSDVVEAEAQLFSTRASALDLGIQRAQLEHAIAILVGKAPAEFSLPQVKLNAKMPPIPVGLPSELLQRRPDIAGAERRVAAANAQIGVARAAYFPALSLSAQGGFAGNAIAHLVSAPNRFWSIGPDLALTLLDFGRRSAATAQAEAAYDETVANYRQTVLAGFQEVEDNLAALRILEQEEQVQDDAVRAARESVVLTLNQYKAGTVSFINVVNVQATQLANERTAVGVLGRRLAASVNLIRALGGGWTAAQIETAR